MKWGRRTTTISEFDQAEQPESQCDQTCWIFSCRRKEGKLQSLWWNGRGYNLWRALIGAWRRGVKSHAFPVMETLYFLARERNV